MQFSINKAGIWYHGSNRLFDVLESGSTITQWCELAEAFSHKPPALCYDDNGVIYHNGRDKGYLYIIEEPIILDIDIYQHPRTTMDNNLEYLTRRILKVKLIKEINVISEEEWKAMNLVLEKMILRNN